MNPGKFSFILLLHVLVAGLGAQETRLDGPVSGLIFDAPAGAIRPMIGVPGASYLGTPLAAGIELAAVSPNGRLALALRDRELYLLRLETGIPEWSRLSEPAATAAGAIVWNSTSTAAAVYDVRGGQVQLWRKLPEQPELVELALPAGAEELVTTLVDSRGEFVIAGVRGSQAGVWRLTPQAQPRLLLAAESPEALALDSAGGLLYVADRARGEILRVDPQDGGATVLADRGRGVSDPVAMAIHGSRLLVAEASTRSLLVLAPDSGTITRIELEFEPSRLEAFGEPGLYLLNRPRQRGGTLHILQDGPEPAVWFVPASVEE